MNEPQSFLEHYWVIITGFFTALAAIIRSWIRLNRRIDNMEARMPSTQEGKVLATKNHVDDCHAKVIEHKDGATAQVIERIAELQKRVDKLYALLLQRRSD